jgi:hypothetical protein
LKCKKRGAHVDIFPSTQIPAAAAVAQSVLKLLHKDKPHRANGFGEGPCEIILSKGGGVFFLYMHKEQAMNIHNEREPLALLWRAHAESEILFLLLFSTLM